MSGGLAVFGDVSRCADEVLAHGRLALEAAGVSPAVCRGASDLEALDDIASGELRAHLTVAADRAGLRAVAADRGYTAGGDAGVDAVASDLGGYPVVVADYRRLVDALDDHMADGD